MWCTCRSPREINGAHCWIKVGIGSLTIQPSELFKLAYILALAWYLRYRSNYRRFRALIGPFVLTLVPMALILVEPDLGTVMLMMPILFTMLFMAGARVKHLVLIILLAVLVSPFSVAQDASVPAAASQRCAPAKQLGPAEGRADSRRRQKFSWAASSARRCGGVIGAIISPAPSTPSPPAD